MNWKSCQQFFVKEDVGMFKASNSYDVFDLQSGGKLLECREEKLGLFTKILRFTDYKRLAPFEVQVRDTEGNLVVEVKRGFSVFLSKVIVNDGNGQQIGSFKQKMFSIGSTFTVLDKNENEAFVLKGKWTGWDFRFLSGESELAHVTKKWAGIGKELFTSADNYVLDISLKVPPEGELKKLIFAAVMCIDLVLNE